MSFETTRLLAGSELDGSPATTVPVLGSFLRSYVSALEAVSGRCADAIGFFAASSAELDLLKFPNELWRESGLPRNGMQRWFDEG